MAVGGVPTVWYDKNTKMSSTHSNKNEKNEYYSFLVWVHPFFLVWVLPILVFLLYHTVGTRPTATLTNSIEKNKDKNEYNWTFTDKWSDWMTQSDSETISKMLCKLSTR